MALSFQKGPPEAKNLKKVNAQKLPGQFGKLGTFECCGGHDTLLAEKEGDNRIFDVDRINGCSRPRFHEGHGTVYPRFPSGAGTKILQGFLLCENKEEVCLLSTDLESD